MSAMTASIEGVGFWASGLPSWDAARTFVAEGSLPADAARKPAPQVLAPNERRRAPESVAVALEVALAACNASGRDPSLLPSVFASTHGDLSITDYICATLADDPLAISPTRFHNSVHNAAAGYWTIGTGCTAPATAISAYDASFAQGLVEAMAQLATGTEAVLLVAYDSHAVGPLVPVSRSRGLLGGALVLSRDAADTALPRFRATLVDTPAQTPGEKPLTGALIQYGRDNAMAPMLPLFQALASGHGQAWLHAGPSRSLRIEFA